MKIALASDHAAFELKTAIKNYLTNKNIEVNDFGTYSCESSDYPIYSYEAAKSVAENKFDFGIIMCGSGQGMQMMANKFSGIRAALCQSSEMAEITRKHNNANVLSLGARFTSIETAIEIVEVFLKTEFEGGRHQKRIDLLTNLAKQAF